MQSSHGSRGWWLIAGLVSAGLFFPGCGTYVWITVKENPGIPALTAGKNVGVAQFDVEIKGNPHILIKMDQNEDWGIVGGLDGPVNVPVIAIQAPDAASKYAVDKDLLTQMAQDNLIALLSGKKSFNIDAVTGLKIEKIADQDDTGAKAEALTKVVAIPKVIDSRMKMSELAPLSSQYNVDLILGGDIEITAEILKATDVPNDGTGMGKPVLAQEGEYGLLLDIYFNYALYDARSGALITDGRKTKTKYGLPAMQGSNIISLTAVPAGNRNALLSYLSTQAYVKHYEESLTDKFLDYIYLFRPHFRSFRQKIEK